MGGGHKIVKRWLAGGLAIISLMATMSAAAQLPPEGRPAPSQPARAQSRSMVVSQYGIVATSQVVASQAGAAILAKGGSAVDAAIAANAALGVIEPMMNGIGGDLFAIVYDAKTKQVYGLNASGWTPAGLSLEALKKRKIDKLRVIDQVTVPGTVAGWDAMAKRWGKLPLAQSLAPAIALAEDGFGIPENDALNWKNTGMPFAGDPAFAKAFLPGGQAPAVGDLVRNPDMAASLRRIAQNGRDGFYKGPTADAMLALQRKLGTSFHFWQPEHTLDTLNDRALELLEAVDLRQHAALSAVELSYGRKRALEIATTLAMEPRLMLLDEPTQGMGLEDVDRIKQLIKKVAADRTVLMVEHNMSVVASLADTITVLARGATLAEGPYAEVSKNPAVIEAYMGSANVELKGAH